MISSRVKTYKINDLEELGIYSKDLIESLRRNQYNDLRYHFSLIELNDWDIMVPILYAVRNEYNTYMIYKYCGENIQKDHELARDVIINEVKLIEGTILTSDKEFIKKSIDINPEIISYISNDLKNDSEFLKECILNENVGKEQIENLIQENPDLAKDKNFMVEAIKKDASMVLLCDKEIKSDYKSMENLCRENDEVISYVASNTNEFGKEGLQASKDVLVDKSSESAINGFIEELSSVDKQIEQAEEDGKSEDELKSLVQRSKQLQRHAKLFERIKSGEIDAVRAAKLIDKICQNIEPEYRQEIEQLITLDNAIIERDREEKSKKMLESGIEATEETVKMEQRDKEVAKIKEIQNGIDIKKEYEENELA